MDSGARPTLRQRLGTLRVVSWPGILVVVSASGISSFFYMTGSANDGLPGFNPAAPITSLLNLALIFLAKLTIFRDGEINPRPVAVVLGLFVTVGLIRALLPWAMGAAGWVEPVVQLDLRIVQSVLVVVTWLTITTLALDALQRQRQSIARLNREQQQLTALRQSAMDQLDSTRAEVDQLVDDRLEPVINRSIEHLADLRSQEPSPDELRTAAANLRDSAQQVVQPLSRELTRAAPAAPQIDAPPAASVKLRVGEVVRSLPLISPFNPVLTPFLVPVSLLGIAIQPYGIALGLFGLAVGAMANFALLSLAKSGFDRLSRRTSLWLRMTLWLVVLTVIAVIVALVQLYLWNSFNDTAAVVRCIAGMIIAQLGCGVLIALNRAAGDRLERDGRAISSTVKAYQVEVTGLMQAQQAIGREIGIAIHGPIQSAFVANSLRLELAAANLERSGDAFAAGEDVGYAYRDLLDTKDQLALLLDHSRRAVQMDEGLAAIAAAWQGLVEVDYQITPADLGASIGQLGAVVIDIIREAVINAAKHGGAKHVVVAVTATETSLDIEVQDDGTGPSPQFNAGVGLGELAPPAAQFSLQQGERSGASLRVRIPRINPVPAVK